MLASLGAGAVLWQVDSKFEASADGRYASVLTDDEITSQHALAADLVTSGSLSGEAGLAARMRRAEAGAATTAPVAAPLLVLRPATDFTEPARPLPVLRRRPLLLIVADDKEKRGGLVARLVDVRPPLPTSHNLLWPRGHCIHTSTVWQPLNTAKLSRAQNNMAVFGAALGRKSGRCSGVVCHTFARRRASLTGSRLRRTLGLKNSRRRVHVRASTRVIHKLKVETHLVFEEFKEVGAHSRVDARDWQSDGFNNSRRRSKSTALLGLAQHPRTTKAKRTG